MENVIYLEDNEIQLDKEYVLCIRNNVDQLPVLLTIEFNEEHLLIDQVFAYKYTGVNYDMQKMQQDLDLGHAVWCAVTIRGTDGDNTEFSALGAIFADSYESLLVSEIHGYLSQLLDEVLVKFK